MHTEKGPTFWSPRGVCFFARQMFCASSEESGAWVLGDLRPHRLHQPSNPLVRQCFSPTLLTFYYLLLTLCYLSTFRSISFWLFAAFPFDFSLPCCGIPFVFRCLFIAFSLIFRHRPVTFQCHSHCLSPPLLGLSPPLLGLSPPLLGLSQGLHAAFLRLCSAFLRLCSAFSAFARPFSAFPLTRPACGLSPAHGCAASP